MAFSIDWFLTVPGILITIGVILLIIALIMFVVSSMKEKKGDEAPSVLENNNTSETPVAEVQEVIEPVSVETPLIDAVSEEVVVPSFEGDNIIPTVEEQTFAPEVENETVKDNSFIPTDLDEVIMPIEEVNSDEVVSTDAMSEEKSFEIPEPIGEVEHRPIYGGADPLEATQTLPKMDVHHEPYSGGTKEVNIIPEVENVIEPVFEVNEEPVNIPEEIPSIISIPDEEEIEEL